MQHASMSLNQHSSISSVNRELCICWCMCGWLVFEWLSFRGSPLAFTCLLGSNSAQNELTLGRLGKNQLGDCQKMRLQYPCQIFPPQPALHAFIHIVRTFCIVASSAYTRKHIVFSTKQPSHGIKRSVPGRGVKILAQQPKHKPTTVPLLAHQPALPWPSPYQLQLRSRSISLSPLSALLGCSEHEQPPDRSHRDGHRN